MAICIGKICFHNSVHNDCSIYDNFRAAICHVEKYSTYLFFTGIYFTAALVGPAIGYVISGAALSVYTDLDVE